MEQREERVNVDIILDTEFNMKTGKRGFIDLISIALVEAETGKYIYRVSSEFNMAAAQNHMFVNEHVLPKLPPMDQRVPTDELILDVKNFIAECVEEAGANRATFWAKNGAAGDFAILMSYMDDQFYGFMRSVGAIRSYFEDTQKLYMDVGRPKLEITPIQEGRSHTALADALHEREVFLACQKIKAAREAAPR